MLLPNYLKTASQFTNLSRSLQPIVPLLNWNTLSYVKLWQLPAQILMLPCHSYTFSELLNSLKPLRPLYHNFIFSSHLDLFTIFMQVQLSHPKPLLPLVATLHYLIQQRPFFTPSTYSFAKAKSFLYLSCILVFFLILPKLSYLSHAIAIFFWHHPCTFRPL